MKPWNRLAVLALLLALPAVGRGQVPPDKAVSTFKVADGLEIALFASEPLFVNPTCMDIDPKGRVWVCESVNYRTKLHKKPLNRAEGDRIVILEDTEGTGKADKATTFYQSPELYGPMGIAVAKDPTGPGYKVYVCQSPDILVFEDKEGKGKADGPPKKLLTGFGGFDHDHGVHGIFIGPDSKLYFSVGDQGVNGLQSSDGKGRKWVSNGLDCRAGTIWRCDLDGKNLELIAHNLRNEYEPCMDSFGNIWMSDNDDDGTEQTRICFVMPGGNYGYHPRGPGQTHWHEEQPGVVPKVLRTGFGSPTGMCFYEGTLLPKKYWGQLLHTDAGPRHLRCYHLKTQGAGFEIDREDMVTSTDTWFRPSDVCVAPDGSVFISDWYDPGVGGHGMGDITRGRIFRITPKGHKGYTVPEYDLTREKGAHDALTSPNRAVAHMAAQQIKNKWQKPEDVLFGVVDPNRPKDEKEDVKFQKQILIARSFWLAAEMGYWEGAYKEKQNLAWLFDRDDNANADDNLRTLLLMIRTMFRRNPDISKLPKQLIGDLKKISENPGAPAGREILLALRNSDPQFARSWIFDLAKQYDGKDRFYLEAIGIAVGHHDEERRNVILAGFEKEFPEWNDKVADLVWELRPPDIIPTLEKRLGDTKLPAAQRARIVDIVATSEDKNSGHVLLKALETEAAGEVRDRIIDNLKLFLPGKWAGLRQSAELTDSIKKLLGQPETRATGLMLVGVAQKADLLNTVVEAAANAKEAGPTRKAALNTLGQLPTPETVAALVKFLKIEPATLRTDVTDALGKLAAQTANKPAADAALKTLQTIVKDDASDKELRLNALGSLAGTRPGTEWLLSLGTKGGLPEALKADTGRLLRNSSFQDLRNKANIVFAPNRLDPKKLPDIAVLAKRKGDVNHGKELMALSVKNDMQCMKCHTVRGTGGKIGPDLSMIGKKASRENLFESILYPSKAIADQYLVWVIETKKGLQYSGLVVEDTPVAVTVRDGNGKDTKIDVKDIDSRTKSPKSIMPEDLLAYMTEDQLVDIVEYLFALKTPALAFDGFEIVGPFDNGTNDAGLDEAFPPEKAKDIDFKATYPGKAGKVGWRTVKPDGQGYFDLAAFFAPASTDIVSYLYREIESPADQEATFLLGADDGCKLWLNGQLVHTNRDHLAAQPERAAVKVKLQKGSNRVLFKINNGNNPHGFYMTVLSELELKALPLK